MDNGFYTCHKILVFILITYLMNKILVQNSMTYKGSSQFWESFQIENESFHGLSMFYVTVWRGTSDRRLNARYLVLLLISFESWKMAKEMKLRQLTTHLSSTFMVCAVCHLERASVCVVDLYVLCTTIT